MTLTPELEKVVADEIIFQRVLNVVESRRDRPRHFVTPCELFDETDALMLNLRIRHSRKSPKVSADVGGRWARRRG